MYREKESGSAATLRLKETLGKLEDFPVFIGRLSLAEVITLTAAGYAEQVFLDLIGLTQKGREKLEQLKGDL